MSGTDIQSKKEEAFQIAVDELANGNYLSDKRFVAYKLLALGNSSKALDMYLSMRAREIQEKLEGKARIKQHVAELVANKRLADEMKAAEERDRRLFGDPPQSKSRKREPSLRTMFAICFIVVALLVLILSQVAHAEANFEQDSGHQGTPVLRAIHAFNANE